jgi:hypothetical protein
VPVLPPADLVLPDEAPDVTATEAHNRLMVRLWVATRLAYGDRALVLLDIFLRVDGRRQAAPDVLVAPPSPIASHRVYRVPQEPVPLATVEVLSEVNHEPEGRRLLTAKRDLFGAIGVPVHLEIDPDAAIVTTWESRGGALVRTGIGDHYDGAALGGVTIETPASDVVHVRAPDGREVLDADAEAARADAEAARADRLAARLRDLGVDPDRP